MRSLSWRSLWKILTTLIFTSDSYLNFDFLGSFLETDFFKKEEFSFFMDSYEDLRLNLFLFLLIKLIFFLLFDFFWISFLD